MVSYSNSAKYVNPGSGTQIRLNHLWITCVKKQDIF